MKADISMLEVEDEKFLLSCKICYQMLGSTDFGANPLRNQTGAHWPHAASVVCGPTVTGSKFSHKRKVVKIIKAQEKSPGVIACERAAEGD